VLDKQYSGKRQGMNSLPLRILIADDNATVRKLLREFLESEPGWIICGEAIDGNDTLAKALELKPDLLLLDISMPQLGGWQVCQSIREKLPEMKILIITEHDPDLMKIAVSAAQVHGFVPKSDVVSALKVAVEAVMNDQPRV
jgi:DNA-binding NarL/FixJ family response regulator